MKTQDRQVREGGDAFPCLTVSSSKKIHLATCTKTNRKNKNSPIGDSLLTEKLNLIITACNLRKNLRNFILEEILTKAQNDEIRQPSKFDKKKPLQKAASTFI